MTTTGDDSTQITDCRMEPKAETRNEKDMEWSNIVTIHAEATCSLLTSPVPIPAPTTHQLTTVSTWLELNLQALPVKNEHDPWPLYDQVYDSEQGQNNVQVMLLGGDKETICYTEALKNGVNVNETLPDSLRPFLIAYPVVPVHFEPPNKSKKRTCTKKHEECEPYVKKPLNAFMLFMKEHRKSVSPEISSKGTAAVNKYLGQKWKSLTKAEQDKYYSQAKVERLTHHEKNPGWSSRQNYGKKRKRFRRMPAKKSHDALETPLAGSQGIAAAVTVMESCHPQTTHLDASVCDVFPLPERFTEMDKVAQIQAGVEQGLNTQTLPAPSQRDGFDPLEKSAEGPNPWLDEVLADALASESLDQTEHIDFDPGFFLDMLFKDPVLSLDSDDMLMNF